MVRTGCLALSIQVMIAVLVHSYGYDGIFDSLYSSNTYTLSVLVYNPHGYMFGTVYTPHET